MSHLAVLKSLGFGIYIINLVSKDGSKAGFDKFLGLIKASGVDTNQITFDPTGVERALVLSKAGVEPSKYEIRQINNEDWEFLNILRKTDEELDRRLLKLEEIKNQLKL